jgi:hypothetical protein
MNKLILLMVSFVFGLAAQAGSLEIQVGPQPAMALPIAMDSCSNVSSSEDLLAPSFAFTSLKMSWNGQGTFKPAYIQVKLQSPDLMGGQYTCTIAGNELEAVLYPNREMTKGSIMKSTCGIRCGSLNVSPSVANTIINGTVTVIGAEELPTQNLHFVQESVPVSIEYHNP